MSMYYFELVFIKEYDGAVFATASYLSWNFGLLSTVLWTCSSQISFKSSPVLRSFYCLKSEFEPLLESSPDWPNVFLI